MPRIERKTEVIETGAEQNVLETKEFAIESENPPRSMLWKRKHLADWRVEDGPRFETMYQKQKGLAVK